MFLIATATKRTSSARCQTRSWTVGGAGGRSAVMGDLGGSVRSSPGQAVDPLGVAREELAAGGPGPVADDRLERVEPLAEGRAERADGPVAAEHHPVGAEH